MKTNIPSFEEHMTQFQQDQREATGQAIQSLFQLKLISSNEMASNAADIAMALNERTVALAHRLQESTDLKQKIDLLSALLVMMNATNVLNVALSKDIKADTRRISALVYMR